MSSPSSRRPWPTSGTSTDARPPWRAPGSGATASAASVRTSAHRADTTYGRRRMKLAGKVAIVTGGARSLGRAYALRLAGLGADVAIADLDLGSAAEFGEELTAPTLMDEIRNCG